jgi:hypothetical protein
MGGTFEIDEELNEANLRERERERERGREREKERARERERERAIVRRIEAFFLIDIDTG